MLETLYRRNSRSNHADSDTCLDMRVVLWMIFLRAPARRDSLFLRLSWGVHRRFDNTSSQVTAEQEKTIKENVGTIPGQVPTSAEALGGLAPHWVFLYQRLATEGDRRVR